MKDGLYKRKDGTQFRVTNGVKEDVTAAPKPDGLYRRKDGSQFRIQNGQKQDVAPQESMGDAMLRGASEGAARGINPLSMLTGKSPSLGDMARATTQAVTWNHGDEISKWLEDKMGGTRPKEYFEKEFQQSVQKDPLTYMGASMLNPVNRLGGGSTAGIMANQGVQGALGAHGSGADAEGMVKQGAESALAAGAMSKVLPWIMNKMGPQYPTLPPKSPGMGEVVPEAPAAKPPAPPEPSGDYYQQMRPMTAPGANGPPTANMRPNAPQPKTLVGPDPMEPKTVTGKEIDAPLEMPQQQAPVKEAWYGKDLPPEPATSVHQGKPVDYTQRGPNHWVREVTDWVLKAVEKTAKPIGAAAGGLPGYAVGEAVKAAAGKAPGLLDKAPQIAKSVQDAANSPAGIGNLWSQLNEEPEFRAAQRKKNGAE